VKIYVYLFLFNEDDGLNFFNFGGMENKWVYSVTFINFPRSGST